MYMSSWVIGGSAQEQLVRKVWGWEFLDAMVLTRMAKEDTHFVLGLVPSYRARQEKKNDNQVLPRMHKFLESFDNDIQSVINFLKLEMYTIDMRVQELLLQNKPENNAFIIYLSWLHMLFNSMMNFINKYHEVDIII